MDINEDIIAAALESTATLTTTTTPETSTKLYDTEVGVKAGNYINCSMLFSRPSFAVFIAGWGNYKNQSFAIAIASNKTVSGGRAKNERSVRIDLMVLPLAENSGLTMFFSGFRNFNLGLDQRYSSLFIWRMLCHVSTGDGIPIHLQDFGHWRGSGKSSDFRQMGPGQATENAGNLLRSKAKTQQINLVLALAFFLPERSALSGLYSWLTNPIIIEVLPSHISMYFDGDWRIC